MQRTLYRIAAALAALSVSLISHAQTPPVSLEGNYGLVSSDTAPVSKWGFSKSRITIKKIDDKHLLILLACEWKREPKAVCSEHYYAQWQESGLFIQDMNTDPMRLYYNPSTRTLTWIQRGYDAKASVRRDVYTIDNTELTDPALVRRMKREQGNADSKENLRVFGPPQGYAYTNNRIELQR
ncbi:hypothetical protein [Massilia sp. CF038]|uniref:hypothetical protein n=1 Tax=Massilia sp. CF038 TaxID=1881045 RepID=UPI0009233CD9|nr:hypothetical protein [Massilia sp. CF038]SHH44055.1 hypothetical protein SAMN05428948_4043 [Massilia sp. CF038]